MDNAQLKAENAQLKGKNGVPISHERTRGEPSYSNKDGRFVHGSEDPSEPDLDFTQILDVDARPRDQYQSTESRIEQSRSKKAKPVAEQPKKTRLVLEEYSESEVNETSFAEDNTTGKPTQTGIRIARFPSGRVGAIGDYTVLANIDVS